MEGKRKADDIVFFRGIQEVGTPIYALQHLERYVEDSFAFRPERWIVDEGEGEGRGEEDVKRVREAWCPFIIGCVSLIFFCHSSLFPFGVASCLVGLFDPLGLLLHPQPPPIALSPIPLPWAKPSSLTPR